LTIEEHGLINNIIEVYNKTASEEYFKFFAQDPRSLFSWLNVSLEGGSMLFADFQNLTVADLVTLTEIALKLFLMDG